MIVPHRHTIGITRREMLQVGYSGLLGVGLSQFARSADQPSLAHRKKPKSLIIVFLTGAAHTPRAREFFESVTNPRLDKPIGLEDLRQAIASMLATSEAWAAAPDTPRA